MATLIKTENWFFQDQLSLNAGLEVIKLVYSLKLKIKRNDWLIATFIKASISLGCEQFTTISRLI